MRFLRPYSAIETKSIGAGDDGAECEGDDIDEEIDDLAAARVGEGSEVIADASGFEHGEVARGGHDSYTSLQGQQSQRIACLIHNKLPIMAQSPCPKGSRPAWECGGRGHSIWSPEFANRIQ